MTLKKKLKKIQGKTIAKIFGVFTFGLGAWLIIVPTRDWIEQSLGEPLVGIGLGVGLLLLGSTMFVFMGMKGD